ncbi:hypothetical protein IQ264_07490 [Phormidium sp. LEGE 05292]|uniref:hypothetical protein n=1 Tax=[Phormidium] sp. LEGE 05292 TaxID=767427 RepID=UPI00188091B3|nr:hypothetical protein [Phormidium sp. LEGE 05292]MBE9225274.1 hypothetical protein [Phormidium sp. LEGE 05292]
MNSNSINQPETRTSQIPEATFPVEIIVSLATGPLLLGVLCGKASLKFLQAVGEASEEVFRGDRLPVLQFPKVESEGN